MLTHEFPILEFDPDKNAFIRPQIQIQPIDISEFCVFCFFPDAIEKILKQYPHKVAATLKTEAVDTPVYDLDYDGKRITLVQALVGAPMAAASIDEMTAYGCKKFIACGGCGVLEKDLGVGHLIIPTSAVRDEGTSYHYVAPSREVAMSTHAVRMIEDTLLKRDIPHLKAKTWTTDAFYRETPAKIKRRKEEGCVTVEMETSAFIAAAQYNDVEFGQILYAGDSLAGEEWDQRSWHDRHDVRELVLRLAIDACLNL